LCLTYLQRREIGSGRVGWSFAPNPLALARRETLSPPRRGDNAATHSTEGGPCPF